jgi:hypothetical protein
VRIRATLLPLGSSESAFRDHQKLGASLGARMCGGARRGPHGVRCEPRAVSRRPGLTARSRLCSGGDAKPSRRQRLRTKCCPCWSCKKHACTRNGTACATVHLAWRTTPPTANVTNRSKVRTSGARASTGGHACAPGACRWGASDLDERGRRRRDAQPTGVRIAESPMSSQPRREARRVPRRTQ